MLNTPPQQGLLSAMLSHCDEQPHIGIFCKHEDERVAPVLADICAYAIEQNFTLSIDADCRHLLSTEMKHLPDMQAHMEDIDACIVIGGDGTMLRAARALTPHIIPIIGINLGRLGFLADISPQHMIEQIDDIFHRRYHCDTRVLMHAEVIRDNQLIHHGTALNDVVMHVREAIRMIEFKTTVNGTYMNQQRADGLVISSPTGSTAYALSAGGPIVHPSIKAFVLVPICPHTLSERPVVLPADKRIEVELCESRDTHARVSFDGQNNVNIRSGDRIIISKAEQDITFIHPYEFDFYTSLRSKLGWSN